MRKPRVTGWKGRGLVLVLCVLAGACADTNSNPSKPASSERKSLQERLSSGGGYMQDSEGKWVPRSDKRSSFESKGESPYFKGKIENKKYRTGDYTGKKSWWGSKEYGTKAYGNTGESRFQGAEANQNGMASRHDGKAARESGVFETRCPWL